MFERSREILKQLLEKKEERSKDWPLIEKIQLAEDCLKQVKNKDEYLEIEKILEELKRELKLIKKGFSEPVQFIELPEVEQIVNDVNGEIAAASLTYGRLKKKADELEAMYKQEMDALKKEMKLIEDHYTFAYRINSFLPQGVVLSPSNIPVADWRLELKESQGTGGLKVMGLWESKGKNPIQEAAQQIQESGRTRRSRR